jgi:hypothetical protein
MTPPPRTLHQLIGYLYLRVARRRVQAWREADGLAGRDLSRDGRWLVG